MTPLDELISEAGLFNLSFGIAVQDVLEGTMQPSFTGFLIASAVNRFIEDVRTIAAETKYFLIEPYASAIHQVHVALVPQLISMH